MRSFAELEERIAALPAERERGAALEVFAEGWLATQRTPQAREVWPGSTAPPSLQQKLRLPLNDMGVDGVYETVANEPTCYQVKFRIGRPQLSWRELSTFFGLSDVGCGRLVFTNCDEIASVAQDRPGVVFVRGSDLDRLTPEDFRAIEAWLSGAAITQKRKTPLPHQATAISDIIAALQRNTRATTLMACGSGKTMVALWVAERLDARTVLVLVPSLALVRQTLHEWLHETNWPEVEYLCVCSDPSVQPEEDALVVRQSDLDFVVTTEAAAVRRFLGRNTSAVRLVFSTYQSSQVVADAAAGLPPFEFGIFDEAHKTAGRDGMKFALALRDEFLPIKRRLFLTATPRHYNVAAKDKFGDAKVVFSMDAPEVYGPVVHRLPFSTAAKLGIITDYRVVITWVTSEMVTDELLRRGVILVAGEEIKARQVANQIALQSAIEQFGVRKIFTFHSRVEAAKSFVSAGSEGIATHLPGFHCAHINGEMPTAYRERLMREFESAPRGIVSNARCLTEGVDVPAVDMVAFLSPRRSLVDIVQATGRAMRRAEGKRFGYVLVPLYVEQARGETVEAAVMRSDFDEVWNVLSRLQEHDDLLAQIVADMRIQRGQTGGFDDSRFRERVQILGPSVSLENLRRSIVAACLDAIGEPWFERYGQLVAYKEQHGDCDIPCRWQVNKPLAKWVVTQRADRNDGALNREKIALLDRIGFTWSPNAREWRSNYLDLLAFRERFGNCRVPQEWKENRTLAKWVSTQRVRRKRQQLSQERIALLDKLGFEWTILSKSWHDRLAELRDYKAQRGNTRVPARWKENRTLGSWVVEQRFHKRRNQLTPEQIQLLAELDFEWDLQPRREGQIALEPPDGELASGRTWDEMHGALAEFFKLQGHCNVAPDWQADAELAWWVQSQRIARKRSEITAEQIRRLDEMGFAWTAHAADWDAMYEELIGVLRARARPGGARHRTSAELKRWMLTQRQFKRRGLLAPERERKLASIGFEWEPYTNRWDRMFVTLKQFHAQHHNCRVPLGWSENPRLGQWVGVQRRQKKLGRLSSVRVEKLDSLGFEWEVRPTGGRSWSQAWEVMFVELEKFHAEHGHASVPQQFVANRKLGLWATTQRRNRRKGKLTEQRIARLDGLAFDWSPLTSRRKRAPRQTAGNHCRRPAPLKTTWDEMFAALQEYKAKHGSCFVRRRSKEDRRLAHWVVGQRMAHHRGKLNSDRERLLTELGFDWNPVGHRWEEMFAALVAFKNEHGHTNVSQRSHPCTELAIWVKNQRLAEKMKRPVMIERRRRLDALGFHWSEDGPTWEDMFARLIEFKKTHDHCAVPQNWREDRRLGKWVNTQRTQNKRGKLRPDRKQRLDQLGFLWNAAPQGKPSSPSNR